MPTRISVLFLCVFALLLNLSTSTLAQTTTPADVASLVAHAIYLDEHMQYEQASASYSQVLQLDPNNSLAYCSRGMDYGHVGKYELAVADLTQAIQLDPKSAVLYGDRGWVYTLWNKHGLAAADFATASQLDPSLKDTYSNIGSSHLDTGMYDEAIVDYTCLIQLDPNAVLVPYQSFSQQFV